MAHLKLKDKKFYDWREIRKISDTPGMRMERLRVKMLQPEDIELSPKEQMYFEMIKKAWTILDHFPTIATATQVMMQTEGLTRTQAKTALRDAQELLGPLLKTNKDYERALVMEKAMMIYDKAIEDGDLRSAALAMEAYAKAAGLNAADDDDKGIPELPQPVFTTDKLALMPEVDEAEVIEEE